MSKRSLFAVLVAFGFVTVQSGTAFAINVTINGFVADLTGIPHDRPNITVRVRSVKANREIATVTAKPDGSFSIPIDAARVPVEDVTLSITAEGTAFINGVETSVRSNGTLFGLAGVIDSKFEAVLPKAGGTVTFFLMLIVPKAEECPAPVSCEPYRQRRLFRFRR